MLYFLDTSFVIALELKNDIKHREAIEKWNTLLRTNYEISVTTYIIDEILTFFNSKGFHSKSVDIYNWLADSSKVKIIHINENHFESALNYFKKHQDKNYSFTDCTSFIVMKEQRIKTALTFDKHFFEANFLVN